MGVKVQITGKDGGRRESQRKRPTRLSGAACFPEGGRVVIKPFYLHLTNAILLQFMLACCGFKTVRPAFTKIDQSKSEYLITRSFLYLAVTSFLVILNS